MGLRFAAYEPLGARARCECESPGPPRRVNSVQKLMPCQVEWDKLEQNRLDPVLSVAEHARILDALDELLELAEQGRLTFGGRYPKAAHISDGVIYELRPLPDPRSAFRPAPRLARMYLGEPALSDMLILGLHLATKPNAEDVHHEQRAAIREARDRADRWMNNEL